MPEPRKPQGGTILVVLQKSNLMLTQMTMCVTYIINMREISHKLYVLHVCTHTHTHMS